jgi:isopentenyldiphosphate isomerase
VRVADELIDICDDTMMPIGTDTRTEAHKRGLWHVAVHCWLVRPEEPGHVLFGRRAPAPGARNGVFDVTAIGHPVAGETAEERVGEIAKALRVDDEAALVPLGVKIEVNRLGNDVVIREFCTTYFARSDRRPHEYAFDHERTAAIAEITIPEGLDLFSGRQPRAPARGVEYDIDAASWRRVELEVDTGQFLPRIDPYYYRIFIMASRMLQGARDLAI